MSPSVRPADGRVMLRGKNILALAEPRAFVKWVLKEKPHTRRSQVPEYLLQWHHVFDL
jgi:hypothetical protein